MVETPPPTGWEDDHEDHLLQQACSHVVSRCKTFQFGDRPLAAVILGSGLGGLANQIVDPVVLCYRDIPGFGTASAGGHRGELILGKLEDSPIIAMAGRFHRYEGWSNRQVAFPVRLMACLGADRLIVSNAAGGVNPKLAVGDIVVIRDHLNFMGADGSGRRSYSRDSGSLINPILKEGAQRDRRESGAAGSRIDASQCPGLLRVGEIYDPEMSREAIRIGVRGGFNVYPGTYLATLGPNYETRSEYRMMRKIGADVAGMSTVPEVLAASAAGMRILGLSMVSNVANPDQPIKADHSEVLEAGAAAAAKLESIVRGVLNLGRPGCES